MFSNKFLILFVLGVTVFGHVKTQFILPKDTIEKLYNRTATTSTEPPQQHFSLSLENDPITIGKDSRSSSASTGLSSPTHSLMAFLLILYPYSNIIKAKVSLFVCYLFML